MSQPLYFLPCVNWMHGQSLSVTRSIIREAGLADIFSDVRDTDIAFSLVHGRGPGDSSGTVVCYVDGRDAPRRMGYHPDEQEWTPVGDGSQLWVGVDKDYRPGPVDLRRRQQADGYPLEMGGEQWLIPVVRRPDDSTCLPTDFITDAVGKLQEPVKAAYRRYWDESAKVCNWFFGERRELPSKQEAFEQAKLVLSINYRFGTNEQNTLRVVDSDNFMTILAYSIDVPRVQLMQEAQKKT
jgi:hypothetical protein